LPDIDERFDAASKLVVERLECGEQLVRRGGEIADASAGRVVYGIDDRRPCPADAELAQSLAAERAAVSGVVFVEKHGVDRADVRVHHDMIARQVLIDERAVAKVDVIFLHQRRADAPDHGADHLRARGLGIENAAGREHAEHAPNADLARIPIHSDLREMRAEGVMRVAVEKLIKIGAKVVSHGRYVVFQMAEVAIPRQMFQEILRLIAELRPQPPPAPA